MLADEMQNATKSQMIMLLTRIGENSKFVINGDPCQLDINYRDSGLMPAHDALDRVDGVSFVKFGVEDVVRDDIVGDIIRAYDEYNRTDTLLAA